MAIESEIDALKAVDEALGTIDKDAQIRVLSWANSKYLAGTPAPIIQAGSSVHEEPAHVVRSSGKSKKKTAVAKPKAKSAKKSKTIYKQVKELNLRPAGKKSAKDFVAEKNPTNQKQKCVVALYYLLHILEMEKAGIDHIYTLFKDSSWPVPADLPNTLHQAGSEGWLDTADATNIKITPKGENIVEHELPPKQKAGK